MSQRRVIGSAALAMVAILASCTDEPERRDALPPACPGSDDAAYAYSVANDSRVDILGLRPDGDVVALTTDGGSGSPSFTPDGESIVFTRAAPGSPGASSPRSADSVWVMRADGSDPTELLRMSYVVSVSVSADGTQLAVIGVRETGDGQAVYLADIDGDAVRRLYEPPAGQLLFPGLPAWSPDGAEVAVSVASETQFAAYAVLVSDGSAREVTQSATVSDLSWSTDGATLSFISAFPGQGEERDYAVVAVDSAGGQARRVVSDADGSNMASADGTSWLIHRSRTDDDVRVHHLVLTDADSDISTWPLPPLEPEHVVSAALAPCAVR